MSRSSWTDERRAEAKLAWDSGMSPKEMGKRFGVTPRAILAMRRRHKWKERRDATIPFASPEQDALILNLWPLGVSNEEITSQLNAMRGQVFTKPYHLTGAAARLGVRRPAKWKSLSRERAWEACRQKAVERTADKPAKIIRAAKSVQVFIPKPEGTSPKKLEWREVYQWGAALKLPLEKRGDIEAVSRAMQLDTPGHPGFVLRDARISRADRVND